MKLIALKDISAQLKEGQEFELDERGANLLLALKIARIAEEAPVEDSAARTRRAYRRRDLTAEPAAS